MSDLINKASQRMEEKKSIEMERQDAAMSADNELIEEVWSAVLSYLDTGDLTYMWCGQNCSKHPRINRATMAKLNGWCKLIGLKPDFSYSHSIEYDEYSEPRPGRLIKSAIIKKDCWALVLEKQSLPNERLKENLAKEYGFPPGY